MTKKLSLAVALIALLFFTACKDDDISAHIPKIPDFNFDASCDPVGDGVVYEVGPGKEYQNVVDVPYEELKPGDVVWIHAKSTPYFERIVLTQTGTKEAPICVCGIPDENGTLPVLDGSFARVRTIDVSPAFNDVVVNLAMVVIGHRYGQHPEYIKIKNLTIQGANQYERNNTQLHYQMGTNNLIPYHEGASGIWMRGSHIEVSNCIIQENGNGIFGAYNEPEEQLIDVKLYNNVIRNNGARDVFLHHNIDIEADSLVAIGNQIGPIREGSLGANYKSRGAGDVIMYNKLVGPAARHFDLVESQNGYNWLAQKESFRVSYVVGNIVEGTDMDAINILHYGGDGDNTSPSNDLRQGTVYAYNNTFLLRGFFQSGTPGSHYRKSFMDLNTCNEKLYAFNNIFAYEKSGPENAETPEITVFRFRGIVSEFSNNLVSSATIAWYNTNTNGDPCGFGLDFGLIESSMATIEKTGFVDINEGDLRLSANSAAINAGMEVPGNLIPVEYQFKAPNSIEPRPNDGMIDIGAYEY